MNLTLLQKATAQGIVNVFESGRPRPNYSAISVTKGDRGVLSYGKHQATLTSGNLARLIEQYVEQPDAKVGIILRGYLERLRRAAERPEDKTERIAVAHLRDALRDDHLLIGILKGAGGDPAMQRTQDEFFDQMFWYPATTACDVMAFGTPLSAAVVFDSFIHGSWSTMKARTNQAGHKDAPEREWIKSYVGFREKWLRYTLGHTLYRMKSFRGLMIENNWELTLPLTVFLGKEPDWRPVQITLESLGLETT